MYRKDAEELIRIKNAIQDKCSATSVKNIYHFTTINTFCDIIKSNSLRLTEDYYLNDRTEYTNFFESLKSNLNNYDSNEHLKDLFKRIDNLIDKKGFSKYYIFSTSSSEAILPMWSLYAKQDGVCIEFNKEKLDDLLKRHCDEALNKRVVYGNKKVNSFKCIYKDEEKTKLIKELTAYLIDKKLIHRMNNDLILGLFGELAHSFKEDLFSFENEIRYVISVLNNDEIHSKTENKSKISKDFFSAGSTIRPYISINLDDNEKLPITGIKISPYNQSETVERGLSDFLNFQGYGEVIIERLKTSSRDNY